MKKYQLGLESLAVDCPNKKQRFPCLCPASIHRIYMDKCQPQQETKSQY